MRRPLFVLLELGRTHAVRGLIVEVQRLTSRLRISIPGSVAQPVTRCISAPSPLLGGHLG